MRLKLLTASLCLFWILSLSAQEDIIEVSYENSAEGVTVMARNKGLCPYTLEISVSGDNLASDDEYPKYVVLAPGKQPETVTILKVVNDRKGYEFNYEYTYFRGDALNTAHDDTYLYAIPFSKGEEFVMSQGYGGEFSHSGKNALDFTMPIGTKVCAARDGIVIKIKEDSSIGCANESCLDAANYITVYHPEDGSFAEYTHLKKKGALVKEGESVKSGQVIAISGDTGFSSGPHLHFVVFYHDLNQQITVPTRFRYNGGQTGFLEEMKTYRPSEK